jgi:Nucleotidyl transferase AbiEii toxin, Type IV TA system
VFGSETAQSQRRRSVTGRTFIRSLGWFEGHSRRGVARVIAKRTTSNKPTAPVSVSAAAATTVAGWSIAAADDTLGSVDRNELVRVLSAFQTTQLEYVLIGATAMGFHGLVRATEDVDLFIRATPENVERLRQALRSAYGSTGRRRTSRKIQPGRRGLTCA